MLDIRPRGLHLRDQMNEVFPNDFSRHELSFSPIRTATLPYISPRGNFAHLKYGKDRFTNHLFHARMVEDRDVLQVEGVIPNQGSLRDHFKKFSTARDAFSMQFTFSKANAAEMVADGRLATAVGIELVSSMLARLNIPNEEKAVRFGTPHFLEWKTSRDAVQDLDDPEKTVLSCYKDKIILETKRGASVILMGKKWLIGKQPDNPNGIYIAQEGSNVWWKLVNVEGRTIITKRINDDEKGLGEHGTVAVKDYTKTQRGWPIWIADQVSDSVSSEAGRQRKISLPAQEWQRADDFEVTVQDEDSVNVRDNSDPKKMPDYSVYKAFDPVLTAAVKPQEQGKGTIVNHLASLDNILGTRRLRHGMIDRNMQELTEGIVDKIRKALADFNSDPRLVRELSEALQREELIRKRNVENIRIESSTFASQIRHTLNEVGGIPAIHPVELKIRNTPGRFLRLQPYDAENINSLFKLDEYEDMSETLNEFFLAIMNDPDMSYAGLGDFTIRDYRGKRTRQAQLYVGKGGVQICTMVPEQLELQTAVIPKPDDMHDLLVHPVITIMAVKGNKIVTGRLFNGSIYPPVNDFGSMLPLNELTYVGSYLHYDLSHLREFFPH